MKKLLLIPALFLTISLAAQNGNTTLKRTAASQLNTMFVTDVENDNPTEFNFNFTDCDLHMKVLANGEDAKFNIDVVWDMAKSTLVFYQIQDAPNRYEVKLGVPAEDINIKFSLGKKLSINANLDETDVDDFQELSVLTNNRKDVDDLVYRLNKIADGCKGM